MPEVPGHRYGSQGLILFCMKNIVCGYSNGIKHSGVMKAGTLVSQTGVGYGQNAGNHVAGPEVATA